MNRKEGAFSGTEVIKSTQSDLIEYNFQQNSRKKKVNTWLSYKFVRNKDLNKNKYLNKEEINENISIIIQMYKSKIY